MASLPVPLPTSVLYVKPPVRVNQVCRATALSYPVVLPRVTSVAMVATACGKSPGSVR